MEKKSRNWKLKKSDCLPEAFNTARTRLFVSGLPSDDESVLGMITLELMEHEREAEKARRLVGSRKVQKVREYTEHDEKFGTVYKTEYKII